MSEAAQCVDDRASHDERTLSSAETLLIAIACGALAANLYYAQPLVDLIAPSVGLGNAAEGMIVTATQIGYAAGLILLLPLGDLLDSRKLVLATMLVNIVAILGMVATTSEASFFAAMLFVGASSTAAQLLVPLSATLTPQHRRGAVVGRVMSGLLMGILLARPAASFLADHIGWRGVFVASAGLLLVIGIFLMRMLPSHQSQTRQSYGKLLRSLATLLATEPVLRRRAFYHAMMFAAFSMFWTGAPLLLLSDAYGFSNSQVALFALVGVLGVFAAPVSGALADRGHGYAGTIAALSIAIAAFALAIFGNHSLLALLAAGVLLDLGVQGNMVISQREIFALDPEIRNRLNAVYMATFFCGGAVGSALVSPLMHYFGWNLFAIVGTAFPVVALVAFFLFEPSPSETPRAETASDVA
ncbi:MFS transporter [Pararhizobium mangrovi]|uniref:MFS transporter n=1 Tax=Pararhizobium mangrovi TaxID=2590452 RepID=A0A506UBG9_9HYPH|nr:MFS transporter [Pararhizobium mangrovi]TPW30726.1 MFS transporter [Pararhizobium mangrovi]